MSEFDYAKQAQRFYQQAPTIILGSGASAAFGLSDLPPVLDITIS